MRKARISAVRLASPLWLALAVSPLSALADMDAVHALQQQLQAGDRAGAWTQAQQLRKQHEGDVAFDYAYGLLALDNRQYSDAQFSLERVVIAEPGNMRARLALAKAYYELGDRDSARQQFRIVEQSQPPEDIQREINRYLGVAGGNNRHFGGFVEAAIGHDNNVNSATSDAFVQNFDPKITQPYVALQSRARQQSDMYDSFQAGLEYREPLSATTGVEAHGSISQRNNFNTGAFDSNSYRASGSLYEVRGQNFYRVTLAAEDNRLSDSDDQTFYSLSADWVGRGYFSWDVFAGTYINELRYDDKLRDLHQYLLQGGVRRQIDRVSHTIGLVLGTEDAVHDGDGDQNARNLGGVYYDARYSLNAAHQLFGRAYAQFSHQNGSEPYFHETRQDDYRQLQLGWDWQLSRPLRLRTEVGYARNASTVDYYGYERSWIQTGLRYSF